MKRCKYCGEERSPETLFCDNCIEGISKLYHSGFKISQIAKIMKRTPPSISKVIRVKNFGEQKKKFCSKCKRTYPNTTEYFIARTRTCKKCINRKARESEYTAEKNAFHRILRVFTNRTLVYIIKEELGCTVCNRKDIEHISLDFHHVEEKSDSIASLIASGTVETLLAEIVKCRLMCTTCHREIHWGAFRFPLNILYDEFIEGCWS